MLHGLEGECFFRHRSLREVSEVFTHEEMSRHRAGEIPWTSGSKLLSMSGAKLQWMTSSPYWMGSARLHSTPVTPGYLYIYAACHSKVARWETASRRCGLTSPGVCSMTSSGLQGPQSSSISRTARSATACLCAGGLIQTQRRLRGIRSLAQQGSRAQARQTVGEQSLRSVRSRKG